MRVGFAIAAGVAIAVAWCVRYSVNRSKQLGLMSGWYSVCAIARRLRAIPSKRAEQLLGLTAGADHLDNEQLLNSVSERLLLSTERNCWHALLQPDVVWHGDEQCVPGLHRQPVRVTIAAGVTVACGVRRVHAPGEQPRLVPERPSPHHLPQRMRDRAPCDQLVVGLDAECRNNGFDNRSAGLLLLNDRHGPVQGNWTWHGKRHHAPDLHRQPVRVGVAIAAGVAWRLQYSVARIQQPRLMSGWYSVCTVGRCLREPADERAQQLLGLTAGANYLDNEQLLNSVSERLLLSTDRSCGHALF